MFESITTPIKVEARSASNYLVAAVAVGLAASVAAAFIGVALFIAIFRAYGALAACLAEIGYLLVIAALAVAIILASRDKARRRAVRRSEEERIERRRARAGAPPLWKDPGVVTTALPILAKAAQFGLRHRTASIVAAGAALGWAAWTLVRPRDAASIDQR